jgi:hypothetical protein
MTSYMNIPGLEIIIRELRNELDRRHDLIALFIIAELSCRGVLGAVLHAPYHDGIKLINHPRLHFLQHYAPNAFNFSAAIAHGNPNAGISP